MEGKGREGEIMAKFEKHCIAVRVHGMGTGDGRAEEPYRVRVNNIAVRVVASHHISSPFSDVSPLSMSLSSGRGVAWHGVRRKFGEERQ